MASASVHEDGPNRQVARSSSTATVSTRAVANHRKHFPQILMEVLNLTSSDPSISEILAWNDDGTSFRILSRQGLEEIVMPQYFAPLPGNKSSSSPKYASFTRKLNRWGFRRITTKGPDMGNFQHYQFRRDEPELIALMECTKRRYGSRTEEDPHGISSSVGGAAAASSHPSASWGSSYSGTSSMGTFGAPGYMHTHAPPPHTEYANMNGRVTGAAGLAFAGHVISGSGQTYSNHHYPSHHYAIGNNRAAMAPAEAYNWNSAGIPGSSRPPPNSNFFGSASRNDAASIGGGIAGAGDSAMHQQQPPPPMMAYQQAAVSSVSPGQQQLVNDVDQHTSLNPAYLSNLEIMALARRDRALIQYRNAAGIRLDPPRVSQARQGGGGEKEDQHEQAGEAPVHEKEGTERLHEPRIESAAGAASATTTPSSEESGTKYEEVTKE